MRTIHGEVPQELFTEFCKIAGHKFVDGEETVISDEVDYWQLTNPTSMKTETKWQKRNGWLPIRDLNFQYAMLQCSFNIEKAIEYAKEKLFIAGKPVYLPELLAEKADPLRNQEEKPPKGYNKILLEEEERVKSEGK